MAASAIHPPMALQKAPPKAPIGAPSPHVASVRAQPTPGATVLPASLRRAEIHRGAAPAEWTGAGGRTAADEGVPSANRASSTRLLRARQFARLHVSHPARSLIGGRHCPRAKGRQLPTTNKSRFPTPLLGSWELEIGR